MASTQPPWSLSRLARWVAEHLNATIVTLAGLGMYAVLRASYETFYGRFGVEPEEVGIGQTEILAQTGIALVIFGLFVAGLFLLGYLTLMAVVATVWRLEAWRLPPTRRPPGVSWWSLWRAAATRTSVPYVFIVLTVALLLAFVAFSLPARGRELAHRVESGKTVRLEAGPLGVSGDLHVEALPVTLAPLGHDDLPAKLKSPSLRYLGQAGGVFVLYDWEAKKTIRVSTAAVVAMTSK
jgi:hypothetical protein